MPQNSLVAMTIFNDLMSSLAPGHEIAKLTKDERRQRNRSSRIN